jgi:CRISPR system Cascade subunit CasB
MTDRGLFRMFAEGDESSKLLISWWEALERDRGERANLRRAAAPSGVVFSGASIAQQMATAKSPGAGARVSGLRFRRLLAVSDREVLYTLLIRVVRLLDGRVNLASLANAAFWWNERTKRDWAYDYYAAAPSEL